MTHSPEFGLFALSLRQSDGADRAERVIVVDDRNGEEVIRVDFDEAPRSLVFDPATRELVAGFLDKALATIDLASAQVVARISLDAEAATVGVRPDGLVVVVSPGTISLVDRRTGVIGEGLDIGEATDARVRPDNRVMIRNPDQEIQIYTLEGSVLVDQARRVGPAANVAFADGRAAVLNPALQIVEIIELSTGDRSRVSLTRPDGTPSDAAVAYPEPDGFWTVSTDNVLARWEGSDVVDQVFMGSDQNLATGEAGRAGRAIRGTAYAGQFAVLGVRPDGS